MTKTVYWPTRGHGVINFTGGTPQTVWGWRVDDSAVVVKLTGLAVSSLSCLQLVKER